MISISQNDWHGYCECEKCRALDEHEGTHAGTLIHFVNAVAEEVEKEHPDILIETLAYQYTRKPPRHVRPRRNVVTRLCSIECSLRRNAGYREERCQRLLSPGPGRMGHDLSPTLHMGLRDELPGLSPPSSQLPTSWPQISAISLTTRRSAFSSRETADAASAISYGFGPGTWHTCSGIPTPTNSDSSKSS